MIDALVIVFALLAVVWVTGDVQKVPNCDNVPQGRACLEYGNAALEVNDKAIVLFFVSLVVMLGLVIVLPQALAGTSIGKAVMNIRVVRPDGSPPGGLRSTARLFCWIVDGLALLLPLALWMAILTPGHRRVGDFVAGTYVVRRRSAGKPVRHAALPWQTQLASDA